MSLSMVLVLFALGAEPALTPSRAVIAPPPPGAVDFDALPPPPKVSDDARVKQFLGAFAGGVVGLGAALAIIPALDSGCMFGFCTVNFGQGLFASLAPFLAVTGAWAGHHVMGGDGGWVTAAAMMVPALLVGLGLAGIAQATNASTPLELMPHLVASSAVLIGGSAVAMHLRSKQLDRLGAARSWGEASAGRVALTSLVGALAAGPAGVLTGLAYVATMYTGLGPLFLALAGTAGVFGSAATAWGVHKGLGGRGSFLSALAGFGIGGAAVGLGMALFLANQGSSFTSMTRDTASQIFLFELMMVSALFAPVIALEVSHTANIEAALPRFSFSAAPTQNGGMIGAAVRF